MLALTNKSWNSCNFDATYLWLGMFCGEIRGTRENTCPNIMDPLMFLEICSKRWHWCGPMHVVGSAGIIFILLIVLVDSKMRILAVGPAAYPLGCFLSRWSAVACL